MCAGGDRSTFATVSGSTREATLADVAGMADLAEAKRQQYRESASPFQRPAADALRVHKAFLPRLLQSDGFAVLVHEGERGVDGFIVGRFGSAPPPFGEGSLFHVDDFAVSDPGLWMTAGEALLGELARRGAERGLQQAIVVSGPARVDPAKVAFLRGAGMRVAAEWWTKPLQPSGNCEVPAKRGFDAAVAPAPPVYDPGGMTALALRLDDVAALPQFESFASASDAVVAIVPARAEEAALREALAERGYIVASEWYAAPAAEMSTMRCANHGTLEKRGAALWTRLRGVSWSRRG